MRNKLAVFVGVPLPGSGAWTGALVAAVLGMPVKQGVQALCVGGVVAAAIVTGVCSLGWIGGVAAGLSVAAVMSIRAVRATRKGMGKKRKERMMIMKMKKQEEEEEMKEEEGIGDGVEGEDEDEDENEDERVGGESELR